MSITPLPRSAQQIRAVARLTERASGRIFTRGWLTAGAGRSFRDIIAVEADYAFARFWYGNDTTTPWTVTKATWSPTARADVTYPVAADGSTVATKPVYFNSAGADSQPGTTTGTVDTVVVPAGGATAGLPSLVCSDWMSGISVPRLDGGTLPLIMHSAYSVDACNGPGTPNSVATGWDAPADNLGRTWKTYNLAGDATIATDDRFAAGASFYRNMTAIELLYNVPGATVAPFGDSISQGQGSDSGYTSWGLYATTALSKPSLPVTMLNAGWSGQSTAQIFERAYRDIARFKPTVSIIACWSPNDVFTQAAADLAFSRAIALAAAARSVGSIPVFWTPFPTARITTAIAEAARMSVVNRLRTMMRNGEALVMDFDAMVTDGGAIARIRDPYVYVPDGQGTHLSTEGNKFIGFGGLQPMLRRVLNIV